MAGTEFGSVLVYVEPEAMVSHALDRAIELTRPAGMIRLTTAIDPWPPWLATLGIAKERLDLFVQNVSEALNRLVQQHPEAGARIETRLLQGRPNIEIVREAIRANCSVIMKDAEGTSPDTEVVAGLDWRLFRKSACPVWLVRSRPDRSGIGVALAPEEDPEGVAFNRQLLEHAKRLADMCGQELHVIQAWELVGESQLIRVTALDEYEDYMKRLETKVAEELQALLESCGMPGDKNVHLVKGVPEEAIVATANRLQLETLVIGTVARGGLAGHLVGNTAERVIGHLRCGVFAVKPVGWKSPVEA